MCLVSCGRLRHGLSVSSDGMLGWLEGSERWFSIVCMEVSEARMSAMSLSLLPSGSIEDGMGPMIGKMGSKSWKVVAH